VARYSLISLAQLISISCEVELKGSTKGAYERVEDSGLTSAIAIFRPFDHSDVSEVPVAIAKVLAADNSRCHNGSAPLQELQIYMEGNRGLEVQNIGSPMARWNMAECFANARCIKAISFTRASAGEA